MPSGGHDEAPAVIVVVDVEHDEAGNEKNSLTGTPLAVERDEAAMKKMMIVERDEAAKKIS